NALIDNDCVLVCDTLFIECNSAVAVKFFFHQKRKQFSMVGPGFFPLRGIGKSSHTLSCYQIVTISKPNIGKSPSTVPAATDDTTRFINSCHNGLQGSIVGHVK